MHDSLLILAQDVDRYNSGVRWVQWGTTGVGVAILLAACWALFSAPPPDATETQARIQKIAGAVLAVVGVGVIAYAWMAHSTM